MKCEATNKNGTPCQQNAVTNTTLCRTHGGRAPAKHTLKERRRQLNKQSHELVAREKALAQRDQGLKSPYRQGAEQALGPDGDVDDPLQVARALAWRALHMLHQLQDTDASGKEYAGWMEMARRMNDSWAKIRTDERYVRITAAQAFGLMAAVDRAMVAVGLDGDTQDRLRAAVAADMAAAQKQLLEVDG